MVQRMSDATGLVRYDAMIHAIAEAHAVDEVKDIRDKAIALERYAQQAMNTEAERKACEIRLRAEKRAGQLTRDMDKSPGGRPSKNSGDDAQSFTKRQQLDSAGIHPDQAKRWERLAAVPDDVFEAALADPAEKPSTNGIIRKANGDASTKMHPDALWIWGRARDFERMEIAGNDPGVLSGEMTDTMQADMARIIPIMVGWLVEFQRRLNGRESIESVRSSSEGMSA